MNVRTFQHKLDYAWNQMHNDFPGFESPIMVPARTFRNDAPMYMRRNIDSHPDSYYIFVKGNPLLGDVSRENAVNLFYDLFINRIQLQSSYMMDGYSPRDAVNMEVLPAQDEAEFNRYYQEQMDLVNQRQREEERARRIDNLGFDPDEEDIIDVDITTDDDGRMSAQVRGDGSSSRDISRTQEYTVDMPRPIWYAVDTHLESGGELGYNRNNDRLGRGRRNDRYLREKIKDEDTDCIVGESFNMNTIKFWNRLIKG